MFEHLSSSEQLDKAYKHREIKQDHIGILSHLKINKHKKDKAYQEKPIRRPNVIFEFVTKNAPGPIRRTIKQSKAIEG